MTEGYTGVERELKEPILLHIIISKMLNEASGYVHLEDNVR